MSEHSRERASERYNLTLTKTDEQCLLGYINSGMCIYLKHKGQTEHTAVCYAKYKKIPIKIVYLMDKGKVARQIITILPFDAEEFNQAVNEQMQTDIENNIKFLKSQGYIVYRRKTK